MSRVGKKAIELPQNVSVNINQNHLIIKGQHGTLERTMLDFVSCNLETNQLIIKRKSETKECRSYHGLIRALVQNMITGVSQKYSKTLIAEGVGYKFQLDKTKLIVNVGFTHPVEFEIPLDISLKIEGPTRLIITGIDKEKVGFLASKIRSIRPPEPYKGKGLLYEGEKIRRKAGKTGK